MDSTRANFLSLLAAYAEVPPQNIGMTDTLLSIGVDSLDQIQLIMDVEDSFAIQIPDEDAAGIRTVAGLYDAILRAQGCTI